MIGIAVLLFARNPLKKIRSVEVVLRISGENERVFTGHLWSQLDQIIEALEEINQPFRLKGAISETVFPYPPLALKELVVNALVHPTFRSLRREKIDLTKDRAKQTENPLMKRLESQDLGLPSRSDVNVEKINPFKALEDPSHGWAVSRLVNLIRNGLRGSSELATKEVLS